MTAAEVKSMIEAAVMKFVGNAEAAPVAVAAPAIPASVGKRTLSEEQKAKMKAGREKARKAKGKAEKPAATVAAVKPAKVEKARPAWEVKAHVTKKGIKGLIVTVGPLSAWLPEGDKARRDAFYAAVNLLRGDDAHAIAAEISRLAR